MGQETAPKDLFAGSGSCPQANNGVLQPPQGAGTNVPTGTQPSPNDDRPIRTQTGMPSRDPQIPPGTGTPTPPRSAEPSGENMQVFGIELSASQKSDLGFGLEGLTPMERFLKESPSTFLG
ncbi:hypothetical protein FQN52_000807 [Onygenales sp. PD_12]|nr:hypothetical protein FQN52_000807 [Onygenales sp. PD_12]KAK2792494.1 hypothetical protein FQN51_001667 [Onygenales sp. PD_10]